MRPARASLPLIALLPLACVPPRAVTGLGTAPDLGLYVTPTAVDHQFAVTLGHRAYVTAIEVTVNRGARLVAPPGEALALAAGRHLFALRLGPAPQGTQPQGLPGAVGPVEPCPVQPFYDEVGSGDSARIVSRLTPLSPATSPVLCSSDPNRPLTAVGGIPPDRYILVVATPDSIGLRLLAGRLEEEEAVGGVRDVLDRIAHLAAGSQARWSAAAIRVL